MATAVENAPNIDEMTAADYYFDSYAHFGIHEEMLKDEVRTETYRKAIVNNPKLFKGKVVLDVGCGTGILSMFAAKAGAARVIGVDCSAIIDRAKQIVKENELDSVITLIKGKVEEIKLPDGIEQVDVIISEWMGYCLLYETMLPTVLYARDKWLKKDGVLMPDRAVMYMTGIEDRKYRESKIDWWKNVYGFDMSVMMEIARKEVLIDTCDRQQVCCKASELKVFDLYTVKEEDLNFSVNTVVQAMRNEYIHGLVVYFRCDFSKTQGNIRFSTSPFDEYTHWKQAIFYLKDYITICPGEKIKIEFGMKQNPKNRRDLDFDVKIDFKGEKSELHEENKYIMR